MASLLAGFDHALALKCFQVKKPQPAQQVLAPEVDDFPVLGNMTTEPRKLGDVSLVPKRP